MLGNRLIANEALDNLNLSGEALERTLKDLSAINRLLGNTKFTLAAVQKVIKEHRGKTLHILDLGCGGGDNLLAIHQWCVEHSIRIKLTGIDGNANILSYAKKKTDKTINYIQADLMATDFTLPECDVLISSHFIYHFTDEKLIDFINMATVNVRLKMIFSELRRSALAYILFRLGGLFIPLSKMAKQDGLTAIMRSFRRQEMERILASTNTTSFQIKRKRFFRLLVTVNR